MECEEKVRVGFAQQSSSFRKMHVSLILPNLYGGGAERNVLRLAAELVRRGHLVDLVLHERVICYEDEIPDRMRIFILNRQGESTDVIRGNVRIEPAIHVEESGELAAWLQLASILAWNIRAIPSRRLVRYARTIASYMNTYKPDFVLPQLPQSEVATLLACRLLGSHPLVIPVIRANMFHRRKRHQLRFQMLYSSAKHFVSVSDGVADSVSRIVGIPECEITTIYNPIPVEYIHSLSKQDPGHIWFSTGGLPIILAAGRLVKQKDFPTLIRAFRRLQKKRPCRLIILGEGRCRPLLEKLVRQLELEECISLPGFVGNPFALMKRASLFVLSSKWEGLPTVLLEALACGCPCVSTDCPSGPAEILKNGRFGELVPVGDELALENAMLRALALNPNRQLLRARAAEFGIGRAADGFERVLATVGKYDRIERDNQIVHG